MIPDQPAQPLPAKPVERPTRFTQVTDGHSTWRCRYGQELCRARCFCGERSPRIDENGDVMRERGQIVWGPACGQPLLHTEDGYPTAFCGQHQAKRDQRRYENEQKRALEHATKGSGGPARKSFR